MEIHAAKSNTPLSRAAAHNFVQLDFFQWHCCPIIYCAYFELHYHKPRAISKSVIFRGLIKLTIRTCNCMQ